MQGEEVDLEAVSEDVTALNEEFLDRLRLLNYQKDFVQSKGNKLITVASFSTVGNPAEQFNVFKKQLFFNFVLSNGCSNLMIFLRQSFQSMMIPQLFPPIQSINAKNFKYHANIHHQSQKQGAESKQSVCSINQQRKPQKRKISHSKLRNFRQLKIQQAGDEAKQDDDEMIDEAEIAEQQEFDDKDHIGVVDEEKQIIQSAVNQNDWKLQCERVGGKLKIQSKQDNKEWRTHIEETRNCGEHIKKNFPKTRTILEKLNEELAKCLEKISKSQKMINSNMSQVGDQYKNQSVELVKLSAHYNNLNTSIKEMGEENRILSEKLQQIQAKTNEHSGSMTDSSPVIKIKESLKNILTEIKGMDVMVGVLSHTILQYKTKERTHNTKGTKNMNIEAEQFDEF